MALFAVLLIAGTLFANANADSTGRVTVTERDLIVNKPTVITDNADDILESSCRDALAEQRLRRQGKDSKDHVAWEIQTQMVNGVKQCVLTEIVKKDKAQEKANLFMIAVQNAIASDEEVPSGFKNRDYCSRRAIRLLKSQIKNFNVEEQYPQTRDMVTAREACYQYSLLKQN